MSSTRALTLAALILCVFCPIAVWAEEPTEEADPWPSVDEWIGVLGVDEALARAEREEMPGEILAYLRSRPDPQPKARAKFSAARDAWGEGDAKTALEHIGRYVDTKTALDARCHRLRYLAFSELERLDAAADAALAYRDAARHVGWTQGQADAIHLAALAFIARFRYPDLVELYRDQVAFEAEHGDPRARAWAEINMAGALVETGRPRSATDTFERVAKLARTNGWSYLQMAALQGAALAYQRLGDYGAALLVLDRARPLIEGDDSDSLAYDHTLRGAILEEFGEFDAAEKSYHRAQELLGEGTTEHHADLLGNLGNVAWRRGEYEKARAYLSKARDIFKELGDLHRVAVTRRGEAEVLISEKKYDEALKFVEQSKAGFRDHPVELAETLGYEALARIEKGDLAGAATALNQATALGVEDENRRTASKICELRGRLLMEHDKPTEAYASLQRATQILDDVVAGLGDEETFRAREQRRGLFRLLTLAAFRTGDQDCVLDAVERSRAAALLDSMGARADLLRVSLDPKLLALLRAAEDDVTAATKAHLDANRRNDRSEIRAARFAKDAALDAHRKLDRRVQREAKRLAQVTRPDVTTLPGLQAALGESDAFVLFASVGAAGYALVVDTRPRIVAIEKMGEILASAEAWRRALADEDKNTDETSTLLDEMRAALVRPLALSKTVERVYVCPDGPLSYLPWTALFDIETSCVPSASTFSLLRARHSKPGTLVLALGDPTYVEEGSGKTRGSRRQRLTPLPGSGEEVRAIQVLVGKERVAMYLKKEASETTLRRELATDRRWRSVHLACHGLVDRRRPRRSALALAPDDANDGFLNTPEVFSLDLKCDAVVLSACDSGRDQYVAAEGVAGLLRAFMAAGAPRVVVSLWKVDDEATKELMVEFYRRWLVEGEAPAAALRGAQNLVASKGWTQPRYWAAWVLWGLSD